MESPRPEHEDDLSLARAVLEGQSEARTGFARRMRCVPRMLAAKNASLGRPLSDTELEDLTQDTLLVVWRKLGTYSGRARLETWVYKFCYLELMNGMRRKGRQIRNVTDLPEGVDESSAVDEPDVETEASTEGIRRFLRHLAPREAEVVRLRHVEGLSFQEIADHVSFSVSSAKTHYYRALEKLRDIGREGIE